MECKYRAQFVLLLQLIYISWRMTQRPQRQAVGAKNVVNLVELPLSFFFFTVTMILEANLTLQGLASTIISVHQRSSHDVSLSIHSPNEGVLAG